MVCSRTEETEVNILQKKMGTSLFVVDRINLVNIYLIWNFFFVVVPRWYF